MNFGLTKTKSNIMKQIITLLAIALIISSCSDMYEPKETHYRIEGGQHQSTVVGGFKSKINSLKSSSLSFQVRFNETARYHLGDNDQDDINKLFGFSDANSMHHDNSARIGWRYNKDSDLIELFAYAYVDGKRLYKKLSDLKIGHTAQCDIALNDDYYFISANGGYTSINRSVNGSVGFHYFLYPYFGGDQVAPHDIDIFLTVDYNRSADLTDLNVSE